MPWSRWSVYVQVSVGMRPSKGLEKVFNATLGVSLSFLSQMSPSSNSHHLFICSGWVPYSFDDFPMLVGQGYTQHILKITQIALCSHIYNIYICYICTVYLSLSLYILKFIQLDDGYLCSSLLLSTVEMFIHMRFCWQNIAPCAIYSRRHQTRVGVTVGASSQVIGPFCKPTRWHRSDGRRSLRRPRWRYPASWPSNHGLSSVDAWWNAYCIGQHSLLARYVIHRAQPKTTSESR